MNDSRLISPSYGQPIKFALIIQAFIVLLASLTLDGGVFARICGVALFGFWGSAAVLIWRRPHHPTKMDLSLIRSGYLLVVLITWILAAWILRGRQAL